MSGTGLTTKDLVAPDREGGVGLATKGLVARGLGESSVDPPVEPAVEAPVVVLRYPSGRVPTQVRSDARMIVVVPTAINICLMAAQNVTDNLRARQASDLELPSLYKRAFLVAYETDEVALVRK